MGIGVVGEKLESAIAVDALSARSSHSVVERVGRYDTRTGIAKRTANIHRICRGRILRFQAIARFAQVNGMRAHVTDFKHPLPSSATSNVDIVDVVGHPRAVELALRFIYPTSLPTIDDLTLLSEALIFADKYDIEAARSRLRPSLLGFARTESLRVYAIACRLGFEDEMKLASSYTTSIHLRGLTQLPDEFRFIPATEYHRLVLLHARYRREFVAIAHSIPRRYDSPKVPTFFGVDISAVIGEVM